MTFNRASRTPAVPTLPQGEQIAAYPTYLEAQKAVDHLSDKAFPVQHVTIVGTDLRMVERVTGRLTYSRVALAGLASGAWFGLFVGLLLSLFANADQPALPILPAIAIGAAFGILFSVISYSLTGGKRDFTSSSQIVASSYSLLCGTEHAHKARGLLMEMPGGRPVPVARPEPAPAASPAPAPSPASPAPAPDPAPSPASAPAPGVPAQHSDRDRVGSTDDGPAPEPPTDGPAAPRGTEPA